MRDSPPRYSDTEGGYVYGYMDEEKEVYANDRLFLFCTFREIVAPLCFLVQDVIVNSSNNMTSCFHTSSSTPPSHT
jgi:hypothetical protein